MDFLAPVMEYLPDTLNILYALITVVVAVLINKFIFHGLINRIARKAEVEEHYVKPLKHMASILIYLVAFFGILRIFGLEGSLTGMLAGAGIAGIVIGFALQDVLSGVVSGIILFITRPFKIGDWVEIDGTEGIVKDLTLQRTRILTLDGEDVTLPNSKVNSSSIMNKTHHPESRIDIGIGVDYDTDMQKAIGICEEILEENEHVLDEKLKKTLVQEFGGSSINLILRFWVDRKEIRDKGTNLGPLKSEIRNEIVDRFRERGIEIPFPHMEIIKKE